MMGSSAGGLGKKHSVLVRLEYGEEIASEFDRIWEAGSLSGGKLAWGKIIEVPS